MKTAAAIFSLLFLAGCVHQGEYDMNGVRLDPPPEDKRFGGDGQLAMEDGLIVCAPVVIVSPDTIRVNRERTRTITFAGVQGPSRETQRRTWDDGVGYLLGLFKEHPIVYIRPQLGADLNAQSFQGSILVPDKSGLGYFDVTQAMVGEGYLKVTDERAFQSDIIAERVKLRETEAKKARKGIWAKASAK